MAERLDVPTIQDLHGLSLDVEQGAEPWVVTITARADNGDLVTLGWDEIAASVRIRWLADDAERLVLEREMVSKISVGEEQGRTQFRVWCRTDGLRGELVVRVGSGVAVSDVLLRT